MTAWPSEGVAFDTEAAPVRTWSAHTTRPRMVWIEAMIDASKDLFTRMGESSCIASATFGFSGESTGPAGGDRTWWLGEYLSLVEVADSEGKTEAGVASGTSWKVADEVQRWTSSAATRVSSSALRPFASFKRCISCMLSFFSSEASMNGSEPNLYVVNKVGQDRGQRPCVEQNAGHRG